LKEVVQEDFSKMQNLIIWKSCVN